MKYYYDFDMGKTFTEEELKKEYEKAKDEYEYGNFDGFIEVESQYMDEISEEVFEVLREREQAEKTLVRRLQSIETEANERLKNIPESFETLQDSENWHYYNGALTVVKNIKELLGVN